MTDPAQGLPRRWIIAKAKIVDYLLNPHHTIGGAKARYFMAFGFSPERPDELADAPAGQRMAQADPEEHVRAGSTKIVFTGPIASPDGRNPHVRSVWKVAAEGFARLVTAVPLPFAPD